MSNNVQECRDKMIKTASKTTRVPLSSLVVTLQSLGICRTKRTLLRWTEIGMTGRNKQKVKMEYRLIGGVRHSSVLDYERAVAKANLN